MATPKDKSAHYRYKTDAESLGLQLIIPNAAEHENLLRGLLTGVRAVLLASEKGLIGPGDLDKAQHLLSLLEDLLPCEFQLRYGQSALPAAPTH